jgi:excisionase family DNA binding protein
MKQVTEPKPIEPSDILTVDELTARLKVSKTYVYNMTKREGRRKSEHPLPSFKMGRFLRFRWSEVSAWLEAQRNRTGRAA